MLILIYLYLNKNTHLHPYTHTYNNFNSHSHILWVPIFYILISTPTNIMDKILDKVLVRFHNTRSHIRVLKKYSYPNLLLARITTLIFIFVSVGYLYTCTHKYTTHILLMYHDNTSIKIFTKKIITNKLKIYS